MTSNTIKIVQWVLTGIVAFVFIGSAMSKFFGGEQTVQMAQGIGIDLTTFKIIGIVELISIILFIIPRTGIIGTLLLVAYMGGAIATHLSHGQSIVAPVLIETFIWIVAAIRFPELKSRALNKA